MTYSRPEVAVLGDAARVIELTGGKNTVPFEDPPAMMRHCVNPAYDPDE